MPAATERAFEAVSQGRIHDAFNILCDAADHNDPAAAYTLASWRMSGDLIRRDLTEAQRLYGIAAKHQYKDAEHIFLALLSTGAGGSPRRWNETISLMRNSQMPAYRDELRLLAAMDIDDKGDPETIAQREAVRSEPNIWAIRGFLSASECRYLIDLSKPQLRDSVVVNPATGALMKDPIRNSRAATFPFVRENAVLHAINRRIAAATNSTYEQGEPTQILAYDTGQEYKSHLDTLPNTANQRKFTFLVYLNDDYSGGETQFNAIQWSFKGKPGDALLFQNIDHTGQPCPLSVHAGCPVQSGTKYLLSKWIRERPLDLEGPPGRPF
ncbi:2OG-Fe(II) oxygenase [Erythrobacter aureus]|uniref:Peptidyl prolyl 4-hydroxylase subunit alpha n=1 Tax=Erythrobacter aureus TaxID=2182384 RepID=A0A345YDE5_9SPHN|nr:2OG-Fe(II) oxygenase [Erythrobacter aureus]AXK41947.1 peptidyl prolyl 4-hydroxylase subunit alpha [Erythrobacter aureus]